ncbi:PepSY-associated TM helix domain-containing protein [Chitinophaga nivalis]|uniref:PepSY domain-containing protein n=1 Tax=Chitinophaga nivalis TaxID=2991709 RepID=A0ABT3IN94_9BACT|nr:PepSY-associated TM helix domain-containing protein [Chitinophaga nivalis]MCW3464896.1 PepSY domain-containing protein [Chitinophaga nivalis]MCW3485413.1 PepSY domain-containing protein [Chitinophaga nivalis]
MKKNYTLRKLFNDIHLWLGLASGLVLFIVCLSGTIYTFHAEVEQLLEPARFKVVAPAGAQPLPVDTLIVRLEQQSGGKVTSVTIPGKSDRTYLFGVKKPKQERGETWYVDPYSATVKATGESSTSGFFFWMMRVHRWLLLDKNGGSIIVGVSTIIFIFLVLTGLVLWFPARLKNIRQGFKIMFSANWKRVNHDLHNTLGFYSFLLLLVMGLTGLCWSFEWYRDGVTKVMGVKVFRGRGEKPMPSALPADTTQFPAVAAYLAKANTVLDFQGDTRISLSGDIRTAVVITKSRTGFFSLSAPDKVQLDRFTTAVLKTERFADKKWNEKITDSIRSLHTGDIFNNFSRILYFIACLIATSLPVTGTLIWVNKFKKKPRK